jgi:hypothetical protein
MESYEELTGYTDEQLVEIFNGDRHNVVVGKQWYLDELSRRRTDHASEALVRLTRQLALLTVLIAILTAVGAAASIIAALRGGWPLCAVLALIPAITRASKGPITPLINSTITPPICALMPTTRGLASDALLACVQMDATKRTVTPPSRALSCRIQCGTLHRAGTAVSRLHVSKTSVDSTPHQLGRLSSSKFASWRSSLLTAAWIWSDSIARPTA